MSKHWSRHCKSLDEAKQLQNDLAPFHQGTTIINAFLVQCWEEKDRARERKREREAEREREKEDETSISLGL